MKSKLIKRNRFRRLTLLDIENLAGSGLPTTKQVWTLMCRLQTVCPLDPRDIVFVGGHKGNAMLCDFVAKQTHGSICLKNGKNGADLALIERALEVPDSAYFSDILPITEFVIGSGDGDFLDLVHKQKARGLRITVVARSESLNSALAVAADRVIFIDQHEVLAGKAA